MITLLCFQTIKDCGNRVHSQSRIKKRRWEELQSVNSEIKSSILQAPKPGRLVCEKTLTFGRTTITASLLRPNSWGSRPSWKGEEFSGQNGRVPRNKGGKIPKVIDYSVFFKILIVVTPVDLVREHTSYTPDNPLK